jgi:hypothetical protein
VSCIYLNHFRGVGGLLLRLGYGSSSVRLRFRDGQSVQRGVHEEENKVDEQRLALCPYECVMRLNDKPHETNL